MLLLGVLLGLGYTFLPRPVDWRTGETLRVEDVWRIDIVDGDTFNYGGEAIRIAGIDAPEIHSPACIDEAALGAEATKRFGQLIREGPFEMIPVRRDRDQYGRKLRNLMRDGQSLGAIMISEGLARPFGDTRSWC